MPKFLNVYKQLQKSKNILKTLSASTRLHSFYLQPENIKKQFRIFLVYLQ